MYFFEAVTVAYISGIVAVAFLTAPLRKTAVVVGLVTLLVVAASAVFASPVVRFWLPLCYLLVGYRLPGALIPPDAAPLLRFEAWLARSDRRLGPWLPALPPQVTLVAELGYLFCYPLVPIAFVLAWGAGTPSDLERFWTAVLVSGFLCYATLPWLLSRSPRMLAGAAAAPGVQRLNVFVLRHASHGWNTFPSGHVAVSWAAAWSLWHIWPAAGVGIAIVAAAISVGAAAGGYHYVIDVLAGWLIAVVVGVITW